MPVGHHQEDGLDVGLHTGVMLAIWISYSKSETARRPRMITEAPSCPREVDQQAVERHQ